MSCQAFYFQTEQPDLVVELITYYTRKIRPDVEKLRTKPQPSYLDGVTAEEPSDNWYQWYTYHDNNTPEFALDIDCLCKIKNILGEVIQFHSTAGEHVPVGFGFVGIDYCSKWNEYLVCDEDEEIQEAFALRIQSPRWNKADDRNFD